MRAISVNRERSDPGRTSHGRSIAPPNWDSAIAPSVNKAYWTEAREELRRQVGTLRFDLNALASAKAGKEDKKKALALSKDFLAAVEDLDLALRKKDKASAAAKLQVAQAKLDAVLSVVA